MACCSTAPIFSKASCLSESSNQIYSNLTSSNPGSINLSTLSLRAVGMVTYMSIPYSSFNPYSRGKKANQVHLEKWHMENLHRKSKLGIDCGVISGESNLQGNQSGCPKYGNRSGCQSCGKGVLTFSRLNLALLFPLWLLTASGGCRSWGVPAKTPNCRWVRRWIWLPSVTEIPRGEMDEYLIILILCVVCVHDSWWGRSIPFIKQGFCHQLVYTFLIHFSANQLNPYALNTSTPSWKKSQHFPRVLKDEERNPKESFNFTSTPRDPRN